VYLSFTPSIFLFYLFSSLPLVPVPRKNLFYLPALLFYFFKDIFVCSWWLYREIHCDIFLYICFISRIGSTSSLSFFLPLFVIISRFLIYTCIQSMSVIFTYLTFFIYFSLPITVLPLACPVLHSGSSLLGFCSLFSVTFALVFYQ
jgi:hypothetical protein